MIKFCIFLGLVLTLAACANETPPPALPVEPTTPQQSADTLQPELADTAAMQASTEDATDQSTPQKMIIQPPPPLAGSTLSTLRTAKGKEEMTRHNFADVALVDPSIRMDIRYATTNNFMNAKIYDCARCLLRPAVARALSDAQKALKKQGLSLKMHDCYRPRPYQQRLWDKKPDADYVTPPAKGSMHSRGAAVDLTIVDAEGNDLDMGTPYDFLGPEAHSDNMNLPKAVLANRALLRTTLEAVGFKGIRTEWWHFSFQGKQYPLDDFLWDCK